MSGALEENPIVRVLREPITAIVLTIGFGVAGLASGGDTWIINTIIGIIKNKTGPPTTEAADSSTLSIPSTSTETPTTPLPSTTTPTPPTTPTETTISTQPVTVKCWDGSFAASAGSCPPTTPTPKMSR